MSEKLPTAKEIAQEGEPCPFCEGGVLILSASGKNLVCRKCGRVVVSPKPRRA